MINAVLELSDGTRVEVLLLEGNFYSMDYAIREGSKFTIEMKDKGFSGEVVSIEKLNIVYTDSEPSFRLTGEKLCATNSEVTSKKTIGGKERRHKVTIVTEFPKEYKVILRKEDVAYALKALSSEKTLCFNNERIIDITTGRSLGESETTEGITHLISNDKFLTRAELEDLLSPLD